MKRTIIIFFTFLLLAGAGSCRKTPLPPAPSDEDIFDACVIPGTDQSLDIVSFNVETFPREGYNSVIVTANLLKAIDADVYALQEVASKTGFNQLVDLMPGYTGLFYPIDNSDWNLAYIFKTSEITVTQGSARLLFSDSDYYPRPAFEVKVSHQPTGIDTYIINNHLKCCYEGERSRREASELMKEYIDNYRHDEAVIVLGDLNDEITGSDYDQNPFLNFINDPSNYAFSDMDIAEGSELWWSYPSYPSHIDHILITDELFDNHDTTMVYKVAPCYPDYGYYISDHRPVGIRLTGNR